MSDDRVSPLQGCLVLLLVSAFLWWAVWKLIGVVNAAEEISKPPDEICEQQSRGHPVIVNGQNTGHCTGDPTNYRGSLV